MSIGVGTLQPKVRVLRPVWLAGLIAVIAVFTMSVMGANSTDESGHAVTAVGRTNANTPTELSGGIAGSAVSATAANTPTELSGGIVGSFGAATAVVPHVPRRTAEAASFGVTLGTTTPTELNGGVGFETPNTYEPIIVNGDPCNQCR